MQSRNVSQGKYKWWKHGITQRAPVSMLSHIIFRSIRFRIFSTYANEKNNFQCGIDHSEFNLKTGLKLYTWSINLAKWPQRLVLRKLVILRQFCYAQRKNVARYCSGITKSAGGLKMKFIRHHTHFQLKILDWTIIGLVLM